MSSVKVGIVGGTGYSGVELMRILAGHRDVEVVAMTSRGNAGQRVDELFPSLRGFTDISFSSPDDTSLTECDLVFYATPNGVAMETASALLEAGVRIVDFSADFRLNDAEVWSQWYGMQHACPNLLSESVYGLPEVNREAIRQARIVANPGCYPTAVQLGFLPLLENDAIDCSDLIADAKSGVSGAGRGANVANLLCEVSDSFKAYAASGHRHHPEIVQGLQEAASAPVDLTFVPHLAPMIRGIHATLYATLTREIDVQALYESRYQDEPFVDVMPPGSHPEMRSVRGANVCRIAIHRPGNGKRVVVLAVEDNLVKGAAGQAVQNMNLMFNLDERAGLSLAPTVP
ncbi:MAG: N-acetyl-gamma-glutamyl-phosphate reductase [Pseudomonadota bacterium]